MADVTTRLRYLYDPTGINQAVAGTQRLEGANAKASASFGLMGAVASAGIFALGTAVVGGIGASIKAAASFEQQMNILQAVTGATAEDIARLDKAAVTLGADLTLPATSALDAAKAMTELSKAGLSVQNTLDAAKGTLQLSAAANITEARAAEIASNALNAFSLDGSKATKVADLLAASANASSGEITDMADAMQMSSAVFASLGFNIEELTTAIGLMANRGIQGSDAGTSLKQAMLALINPTAKAKKELANMGVSIRDSSGAIKPLRTLINEFTAATSKMGNAQRDTALDTIFGSDAIRAAFTVMTAGTDQYDKMFEAVTKVGAAEELAAARTKGLSGAWNGLQSQLETLALVAGRPLLAGLTRGVRGLSSFVGFLANQLVDTNSEFMRFARSARTAVGPAMLSMGRQFVALGKYVGAVIRDGDTLNEFLADMSPAFRSVAYVIGTTITQLQSLGNALMEVVRSPFVRWIGDMVGSLLRLAFGVREGSGSFQAMIAPLNLAATALTGFIAVMAVQTVLGFVGGLASLAASIITFPLRPLISATSAVADFVKAAAGLVSRAVSVTTAVPAPASFPDLNQRVFQDVKRTGDKFLGPDDLADKTQAITQKMRLEGPPTSAVDEAATKLGQLLGGVLSGLGLGLGQLLWGRVLAGFVGAISVSALASAFAPVAAGLGALVAALFTPIGIAIATAVIIGLVLSIPAIRQPVGEFIGLVAGGLMEISKDLNTFKLRLAQQLKDGFQGAVDIVEGIWKGLPRIVLDVLLDVGISIRRFTVDLQTSFPAGILRALETASIYWREFPGKVLSALEEASAHINTFRIRTIEAIRQWVADAGRAFLSWRPVEWIRGAIADFIDAIQRGLNRARDLFDDLRRLAGQPIAPSAPFVPAPSVPSVPSSEGGNQGDTFQTPMGGFRLIPGSPGQPQEITAHGGEVIGRPASEVMGGGTPIVVNINLGSVHVSNQAEADSLVEKIRRAVEEGLEESLLRQIGMASPFPHALNMRS